MDLLQLSHSISK